MFIRFTKQEKEEWVGKESWVCLGEKLKKEKVIWHLYDKWIFNMPTLSYDIMVIGLANYDWFTAHNHSSLAKEEYRMIEKWLKSK